MKLGSHISISNGIENAPLSAMEIGCECFQIFSKSPKGGPFPELSDSQIKIFKENLKKAKIDNFYIHAPYYINLASQNNRVYYGAIKAIRDDLERGDRLGAKYVMTHIGSSKDSGEKESIEKVIKAFEKILDEYDGLTKLLIENSAGAGSIIGDSWKEIGKILNGVNNKNLAGICFDTAHAFESGYDLRDKIALEKTINELDKFIGIEKIKVFHGNDSQTELGSHKDRHANIGKGKIGKEGFSALISDSRFADIDMILETPREGIRDDLEILKDLRFKKTNKKTTSSS